MSIENPLLCTPDCTACSTVMVEIDAALERLDDRERRLEVWFTGLANAIRSLPNNVHGA